MPLAPNKTQGTTVLSLQTWATATTIISSAIDVSGKFGGTMFVHFGRTIATALANNQTFRIEASAKSSGDGQWFPIDSWQTATGTATAQKTTATAGDSGQKVITVTNTGFSVQDIVFAYQSGSIANSEFGRIVTLTSTTAINLEDNLVNVQTTSDIINKAEMWARSLDFAPGIGRIRLVCDGSVVSGQTCAIEAFLSTFDSVG